MLYKPTLMQTLLLQAALFSDDRGLKAWEKWSRQVDFDKIDPASYKLLPLLSRNPCLQTLQDPLFEKCKGIYQQVWLTNQLTWNRIKSFLCEIPQIDKIILLKGIAMILHYYKDFGVRILGDIDILIAKSEAPLVYTHLAHEGWHSHALSSFDITNESHLSRWHAVNFSHPKGLHLDLHWSFIEENVTELNESVLKNSELFYKNLYVPNATHLLIQICVHGIKPSPEPLIRWIADAITLLRHAKIDWEHLLELAKQNHLRILLSLALTYLSQEWEAPIPFFFLDKLQSDTYQRPFTCLESLEFWAHRKNHPHLAAFCRSALNQSRRTLWAQLIHIPHYIHTTARLKSWWSLPFFVFYYPLKQLIKKSQTSYFK